MFKFYIKNVIIVIHVLVKRSKRLKNTCNLCTRLREIRQKMVGFGPRTSRSTFDGVDE